MKNKILYKKIIVVVCLLCSLFMMFVSTVGATATSNGADSLMVPYFYPEDALLTNSAGDSSFLLDFNTTIPLDYSGDSPSGAYGESRLDTYNSDLAMVSLTSTITASPQLYNGYGYTYSSAEISTAIYDVWDTSLDILRLSIRGVYFPGTLVNNSASNSFNWLGNWSVFDASYSNDLTATRYRLRFNIVYIDSVAGGGYSLKNKEYDIDTTQSVLTSSVNISSRIRDTIQSDLTYAQRSRGVLLEYCYLQFYGVDFSDGVEVVGFTKFVNENQQGFNVALANWRQYFGSTVVSNQSIIGSIVDGITDIWNLRLFGEFSIGALFSAVVGLSCFIWILRVFAGG